MLDFFIDEGYFFTKPNSQFSKVGYWSKFSSWFNGEDGFEYFYNDIDDNKMLNDSPHAFRLVELLNLLPYALYELLRVTNWMSMCLHFSKGQ